MNRKNELAARIAEAAVEQMDMKDLVEVARNAIEAEYAEASDDELFEACIDYDIDPNPKTG